MVDAQKNDVHQTFIDNSAVIAIHYMQVPQPKSTDDSDFTIFICLAC